MENAKESPGENSTSSKSDLIILTPDELLKLGLFKDLQKSSSQSGQVSNEPVSDLKQKKIDKFKTATQYTNNEADNKSKHKEYKKHKRKSELVNVNSEIPSKSGNGTSGTPFTEKEKLPRSEDKSTSMLAPGTSEISSESYLSKSKLKSGYNKIKKPLVLNSIVASTSSETSIKILNTDTNFIETEFAIPHKQMGLSKSIISKSALYTNNSSTNEGTNFINKKYNLENESMKHVGPKKEVNVISNTPVCFSTEELKHLTSKTRGSPENKFQNISVGENSEKLQIIEECGKQNVTPRIEIQENVISEENIVTSFNIESQESGKPVCSKNTFFDLGKGKEVSYKTATGKGSKDVEEHKSQESEPNILISSKPIKVTKKDKEVAIKDSHNVNNKSLEKEDMIPTRNKEFNTVTDIALDEREVQTKKEIIEKPPQSANTSTKKFIFKEKSIPKSNISIGEDEGKEGSNQTETVSTLKETLEIQNENLTNNPIGKKILEDCSTEGKLVDESNGSKYKKQPENEIKYNEKRKAVNKSSKNVGTINQDKRRNTHRKLEYSTKRDESITSRSNKRRKRRTKFSDSGSEEEVMQLKPVLKVYSRKSKENIVSKDKTFEDDTVSNTQLSNPDDSLKIESKGPASEISDIRNNIKKSEKKNEEVAIKNYNSQAQGKTDTELTVPNTCGRKRKMLDVGPTLGECSTHSNNKIRDTVNNDKNNTLQKVDELDNHSVKMINKTEDKLNKTLQPKKKPHGTSLQMSLKEKLLGFLRNAKSEEVSKDTNKSSEEISARNTQEQLKTDEKIRKIEENDTNIKKCLKEDLNVTSLQKSIKQVVTNTPRKRGRPRKNLCVENMPEDSELNISSSLSEQIGSSSTITETDTSAEVHDSPEKRIKSNKSVNKTHKDIRPTTSSNVGENKNSVKEKIKSSRQVSNIQYSEEYNKRNEAETNKLLMCTNTDEIPVLQKSKSQSVVEAGDSTSVNLDQLNVCNKKIEREIESSKESDCISGDSLLKINQSENVQKDNISSLHEGDNVRRFENETDNNVGCEENVQKNVSIKEEKFENFTNDSFSNELNTQECSKGDVKAATPFQNLLTSSIISTSSNVVEGESPLSPTPKMTKKRGRPRKNTTQGKVEEFEDKVQNVCEGSMEKDVSIFMKEEKVENTNDDECPKGDIINQSEDVQKDMSILNEEGKVRGFETDKNVDEIAENMCEENMQKNVSMKKEKLEISTDDSFSNKFNTQECPKGDVTATTFQKSSTPLISSTSNDVVEGESSLSPTPKMPRRRGRPRKNTTQGNVEECEDKVVQDVCESGMEKDFMKEKNVENTTDECPKGDVIVPSFDKPLISPKSNNTAESDTIILKVTRRGRPKKNTNVVEIEEQIKPTMPLVPNKEKPETYTSNQITAAEASESTSTVTLDDIKDESFSGRKRKRINYFEVENSLEIEDDVGNKKRCKSFSPASKISKTQPDDESDISNENVLEKKSKSKKTGETIMLLNSIFTAAFKNKPSNNSEAEENDKKGVSDESLPNALVDRRTKSSKTAGLVLDEDNMVMCMLCNKKVKNEDWNEHNQNVHYNLSWRNGESEVNMDDSTLVRKRLKPVLQKHKSLKCNKCGKDTTNANDYLAHRDICSGIVSSNGFITCAVCNTEMVKSKWSFHKQKKHNNLAWRVGDRPLNLNDQNLVLSILNALYKARKPLHCEKCGTLKKSVIGFLSHQAQCGSNTTEELKVKCEFCDRKVLPVSMQSHIKMVHETPKKEDYIDQESNYFDVKLDSTLPQRKAAKTAMQIIDKISKYKIVQEKNKHYVEQADFLDEGFINLILQKELLVSQMVKCKFRDCEFETNTVKTLLTHMNSCERKPQKYYVCKKCLSICETKEEINSHIKTTHNIDIIEDDFKMEYDGEESDEDNDDELIRKEHKRRISCEKKKLDNDTNYKLKPSFLFPLVKRPKRLFSHAFAFTMEFCQENFSQSLLFDNLRNLKNDWTLLNHELADRYLPQSEESCSVARRTVNNFTNILKAEYTFKKFELFESECDKGNITIFCGGPIYAMAWLPTPHSIFNSKQILAVAAGKCFEEKHVVNENYSDPSLIQFWDFGVLKNRGEVPVPKLMFCLAFEFGPVWHMEWCPSGCFDENENGNDEENISRMGLLAVAGSDSVVYIYSIPVFEEEEMGLIYQVRPVLKLQLVVREEMMKKRKFFPTRISWSMTRGHRHLAVGYTDGIVGLYDMDTNSKLLKFKDDDVDVLLPYKYFQAHTSYVSGLNWVPLSSGNRWLITTSFDRCAYIWDLSNDSKISVSKKAILTDSVWLSNWISFVTSADESSTNYSVHTAVESCRGYMYDHAYIMMCPSTVTSISSSSWLNSIIQGNAEGEITAMFPNQMLYNLNLEKRWKSLGFYLSCTKLIDKNKTPEERVAEEKLAKDTISETINNPAARRTVTSELLDIDNPHYSTYEPITYKEANQKYGILFCDMKMDKICDLPKTTHMQDLSFSKPNLYSLQKINKIVYNPNRQASLYYATGHQAGFVRVAYIKFFERDPQVV